MDILDYLIEKGNFNICSSISSKKFFLPLINLLKIKDIAEVQIKLLHLIEKWGRAFENQKKIIHNFSDIYTRLKSGGIEFPIYTGSDYNKYFLNDSFYYFDELKNILKVENFHHKYRRLVDYLLNMNENIKLANELIDLKESEELDDIIEQLEKGNEVLKDTIIGGRLKDEKLMDYTLGTTEDIKSTISRKEEFDKGINDIPKFESHFEKNKIFIRKNNLLN